jgi:hypothetical protein
MIVPHKSNYSKLDFFDFLIPLGKTLFSSKGSYCYNKCKKSYDSRFTKYTFCIHPTILPFLPAMGLNGTPSKRSNSNEEMVGEEYEVERLKRLTCEALPVSRGKILKWRGNNNMGNNDNSVVTEGS